MTQKRKKSLNAMLDAVVSGNYDKMRVNFNNIVNVNIYHLKV